MEIKMESGRSNTLWDRTNDLGSRIRMSFDFLCKDSTNLPEVLAKLFRHGLLSQRESQVIENQLSDYDSFRKLFTLLIPRVRHGDNSQHFFDAFKESYNEHILERLNSAPVTKDLDLRYADKSLRVRFNVQEPVQSFSGRENFLRDLDQHILQSQRTAADAATTSTNISRICVVMGLGGIGKTETIRKYINNYGHCYQHVVWIDAEEHNTAENQFRRLALELQISSKDIDGNAKDFDFIRKDIYDRLCTSSTLLVLDNAEALHDSDPRRPGVARFLPKCQPPTFIKPVVLITSRHQHWPNLQPLLLPCLASQESSLFIFRQLNLEESDANAKDAKTLSETFGGLPLALQAAAAVICQKSKQNEWKGNDVYSIQHLLSDYNQGRREVLDISPPGSPESLPLMLLWKVSLDKIQQQPHGHLAIQILNVMAHLSSTNIPKELLFFIFNSEDTGSLVEALVLLGDYSLVHNFRSHFSIHRMLQDVTLAQLETPTEENSTEGELLLLTHPLIRITTALKKYWLTVPKSSKAYDAIHDNLVHVTMSYVLPKVQNPLETNFVFIEFVEFVMMEIIDTRWVEAEKCCRVLIAYLTSSVRPSDSSSVFEFNEYQKSHHLQLQLVWILQRMGRYKEAGKICQELLSSFNSLANQKDIISGILATKHYLAMILDSLGEYEKAIKLHSSVIDLLSDLHGPTHKFTLNTKNNLAAALQNSGRLSEAKTLHAEILEVRIKELGLLHPSTLTTKHNMALILRDEGRYNDALEMLRGVSEVQERELGPFHASTLISSHCIAHLLQKQGKHEDALRIYAHVISSYEKASSVSHPDYVLAKNNMALLEKQRKADEA